MSRLFVECSMILHNWEHCPLSEKKWEKDIIDNHVESQTSVILRAVTLIVWALNLYLGEREKKTLPIESIRPGFLNPNSPPSLYKTCRIQIIWIVLFYVLDIYAFGRINIAARVLVSHRSGFSCKWGSEVQALPSVCKIFRKFKSFHERPELGNKLMALSKEEGIYMLLMPKKSTSIPKLL